MNTGLETYSKKGFEPEYVLYLANTLLIMNTDDNEKIVYNTRNINIYFSRLEEIDEGDSEIFNISFVLNSIDWSIIKEESIDIISENSNCVYIGSDNNMRVSLKDTKLTLFLTHRTQIRNINSIFPEFTINIQLFYFQWYSMWWINWLDIWFLIEIETSIICMFKSKDVDI